MNKYIPGEIELDSPKTLTVPKYMRHYTHKLTEQGCITKV